jgi:hypothetical protein
MRDGMTWCSSGALPAAAGRLGDVKMLPARNCSLLVRTDFASEHAWQQVSAETQAENSDGFRAFIERVTDRAFDTASWQAVKAAVPARADGAVVLFVADHSTMTLPEHPILVVDLLDHNGGPPFRCIPAELWAVENNLNIANLSWEEFGLPRVFRTCD